MKQDKINIISLINSFGVKSSDRADFLYNLRKIIKLIRTDNNTSIMQMPSTFVQNELLNHYELTNPQVALRTIVGYIESIGKTKENRFYNLIIAIISNYLNALKYSSDKHKILFYADNEYWNNINAQSINDEEIINDLCTIYHIGDAEQLDKPLIINGEEITFADLKIKTIDNYEKSIIEHMVNNKRAEYIAQLDKEGLIGKAKNERLTKLMLNYKKTLNS